MKHKMDLKKDSLRLSFDLNKKQYVFFYGNQELAYEELNRKTKKKLEEENIKLIEIPGLLESKIDEAHCIIRFNYLKNLGYTCNSFEYLGPVDGTMTEEIRQFMNYHTTKENVLLGIHRVGNASNESIKDMLKNGIIMSGNIGSGALTNEIKLNQNVGYYPDNKTIIKELMYANNYKNSSGSILIEIPYEDLTSPFLYVTDESGVTRLNPKYTLGFVPVDSHHHLSRILNESDFKKEDNYNIESYNMNNLVEEYILAYIKQAEYMNIKNPTVVVSGWVEFYCNGNIGYIPESWTLKDTFRKTVSPQDLKNIIGKDIFGYVQNVYIGNNKENSEQSKMVM